MEKTNPNKKRGKEIRKKNNDKKIPTNI